MRVPALMSPARLALFVTACRETCAALEGVAAPVISAGGVRPEHREQVERQKQHDAARPLRRVPSLVLEQIVAGVRSAHDHDIADRVRRCRRKASASPASHDQAGVTPLESRVFDPREREPEKRREVDGVDDLPQPIARPHASSLGHHERAGRVRALPNRLSRTSHMTQSVGGSSSHVEWAKMGVVFTGPRAPPKIAWRVPGVLISNSRGASVACAWLTGSAQTSVDVDRLASIGRDARQARGQGAAGHAGESALAERRLVSSIDVEGLSVVPGLRPRSSPGLLRRRRGGPGELVGVDASDDQPDQRDRHDGTEGVENSRSAAR